jgi:penicillin amidase
MTGEVEVVYDRRGVPHIWASSADDAIRALGFVVARDRLFQLEVQSRAPEGTLTELAGEAALSLDRQQRRLGFGRSAEREMRELDARSPSAGLLRAYADGINAWIDGMGAADMPFEYHLLNAKPRRWEPIHSLLLNKRMAYTLVYDTQELWRARVEALVGKPAADALFPVNHPIVQPIQPNSSPQPRFDFQRLPDPAPPNSDATSVARLLDDVQSAMGIGPDEEAQGPAPASNNWAVSPSRTAGGYALLSGDPHLELTLPSIWYEVHLVVAGVMDVHGVTIPGLPTVIIGFNRDVAWSFTNTGADVLDFYRETVDSEERPTRYMLDGEWKPVERRIEEYRDPRGAVIATDTVRYTHRGPVRDTEAGHLSMRWTMLEHALSMEPFLGAAGSTTAEEWLRAMAPYPGPAQNMIVADREGNIAIRSTGLYPIRPDNGDGQVVRDGSTSASDWLGYWPLEEYPTAVNPAQGFLASANQQPLDPALGRLYLGANWETPWRAMRINQLLAADSQVTPDAMRRYHTDPGNVKADLFVPAFLEAARGENGLDEARRLLEEWDRRYTKENERAILFELALNELDFRTFDELFLPDGRRLARRASRSVLAGLLRTPDSPWWDDRRTSDRIETRDDVLAASLEAAMNLATERYGDPDDGGWRWSAVRHNNISHLLGLPALSRRGLPVQGGPGNLNPSSGNGNHGSSWRMVVEMGPEVRAWATYPGGQSGNPASPRYADRIDQWVAGELDEVLFPHDRADLADDDVIGVLTLRGGAR